MSKTKQVLAGSFCLAVLIILGVSGHRQLNTALASYDRNPAISTLNMGKILATGTFIREYRKKEWRENPPTDTEIRHYLVRLTNYNGCADGVYLEDLLNCANTISQAEVELVYLAATSPESFEVKIKGDRR